MTTLSPPVAIYQTPLKGMDARAVKPVDSPNLLVNVDLSNRGYWKQRPGVRIFTDAGASGLPTNSKIMGLHSFRIDGRHYIFVISAKVVSATVKQMWLTAINGAGARITGSFLIGTTSGTMPNADIPIEPFDDIHYYSFIKASRFLYFCNGYGNLYEVEFHTGASWTIRSLPFEEGASPLTKSYILGSLRPSALSYFSEKIHLSGFKQTTFASLSSIAENNDRWPSPETLNQERNTMSVDSSTVLVSEYGRWRSYAPEDQNSNFWIYNDDIISTIGMGTDLLLFGQNSLYKVIGPNGERPQVVKLGALTSVGAHAQCYFDKYVLFVCLDGIYITDGQTVRKVSFEMDPLWFGREEPQVTRSTEQKIIGTAYPFHVNRNRLQNVQCVNDRARQQVMITLPANDSEVNSMVWVYNYSDMLEGNGQGKWAIWCSDEQPTYSGTSLDSSPFIDGGRNDPAASPTQSNTTYNLFHWNCVTEDIHEGRQRIFFGTDKGQLFEFGTTDQDFRDVAIYNVSGGVDRGSDAVVHFPVVISLGRVGRADSDGRIICTDVAVRRKQFNKNSEEDANASQLIASVRSEGEGIKHFDVSETDVEFEDQILNSQQGFSENTKSTLGTMVLGASPAGSNAPLMNSEYFEAYARVNVPDEEGRSAYVDLYSKPTSQPHRLQISEVRVYATVKGGSQREQS